MHLTRKACASLLVALDVHPRVAAQILRHSKIAVTMEVYAEHNAEAMAEDPHRRISDDHDLAEVADQRAKDQHEVDHREPLAQLPEPDIRDRTDNYGAAESMSRNRASDDVRVPTADETADSVRAQRALQELKNRQASDARHAEDEAGDQVSRWHADQESRSVDDEARSRPANQEDGHDAFVLDAFV